MSVLGRRGSKLLKQKVTSYVQTSEVVEPWLERQNLSGKEKLN